MRKPLFIAMLTFVFGCSGTVTEKQPKDTVIEKELKGIDLERAVLMEDAELAYMENGGLMRWDTYMSDDSGDSVLYTVYMISREHTPIALKHNHEYLVQILEENGMDFKKPYVDESYMSGIKITEYDEVVKAAVAEVIEIKKSWYCCGYLIRFIVDNISNTIMIEQPLDVNENTQQ